jgi:hypothetical protein
MVMVMTSRVNAAAAAVIDDTERLFNGRIVAPRYDSAVDSLPNWWGPAAAQHQAGVIRDPATTTAILPNIIHLARFRHRSTTIQIVKNSYDSRRPKHLLG